ncbi:MAG TPA: S9 family peptidase [Ktedonobacterales bacterium]|jgi:dipeptidyl aminopeptidase/acylaminoacyl peptidase
METTRNSRYGFESYLNIRSASGASFSPDGQRLTFLTDITGVAEVWRIPVDVHAPVSAWPEQLTFRGERASRAAYSPTDETILVAGDVGGNEHTQLWLLEAESGTVRPLTSAPEIIHEFGGWSPDGMKIAFASNARDPRFFDVYEQTLAGGSPRLILRHDGTNHPVRYAPDGRSLLISRVESNIRNQLLLLDIESGEARPLTPEIGDGPASHVEAAWSADGRGLYLLSDRNRSYLSLAWLDLVTTEMTFLRDISWDTEELAVSDDGTRLALVTNEEGYSRLEIVDAAAGWAERRSLPTPTLPACTIHDLKWSPDGARLAFTLDTADDAPDVWVWDVAETRLWRATRSARGGIAREHLVAPALVHYPTFDGRQIPAFLYLPQDMEARRLPAIVYVHGGPEGQFRPNSSNYNSVIQYLVGSGFVVLAPNVRGSTGYGYEYQSLDDVRLRMDSVADLPPAARWLAEQGIADPQRIAVMGRSYGGFMVLSLLTTSPEVWAAGVELVGIANFVTFLENTGPWRRKLREAEYGSLERDRDFLEHISPIHAVDRITAPLFVAHGANDPRVPVSEAEQMVEALRRRNVPVEYLRFDDEGHQFTKRSTHLIVYPAIARFLDTHLRAPLRSGD